MSAVMSTSSGLELLPDIEPHASSRLAPAFGLALLLEVVLIAGAAWMLAHRDAAPPLSVPAAVQVQLVQLPKPVLPPKLKVEPPPLLPKPVVHHVMHPRVKPVAPLPLPAPQQPAPLPPSPVAAPQPPKPPQPQVQRPSVQQSPVPTLAEPSASAKASYLAEVRSSIEAAVQFPSDARLLRQQGQVQVQFQLKDGAITNLQILTPGTLGSFNDNALNAVRSARIPQPPKEMMDKTFTLFLWVKFKLKTF